MEDNGWVKYPITTSSFFFPIFQQVLRQTQTGTESVNIVVVNKDRSQKIRQEVKENFKFVFDWQLKNDSSTSACVDDGEDCEICGVEVFKQINGEIL